MAATNLAFAPRGQLALPNVVTQPIPEIGVTPGEPLPGGFRDKQGCGCETSEPTGFVVGGIAFGLLALRRRKRG
ncbi:MAG: MYXO-CTERM sorting domain-containing protein [Kofleriaceae bacterium]